MPRVAQFERKQIVAAAIEVARREGLRQVSARRVAKQLGASTSVIYGQFDSVDALRDAAIATGIHSAFLPHLPRVPEEGLRAIVVAFSDMARADTWLVEQLAVRPKAHPAWALGREALAGLLAAHPRYAHLDEAERIALVSRFTMACVGVALSWAAAELTSIEAGMAAVVEPVIEAALARRPTDNLLAGSPMGPG